MPELLRDRAPRRRPPGTAPRRAARVARRCAPARPAGGRPWWSNLSAGCTRPGRSRAGVNLIASSLRSPNAASRRSAIATCGSFTPRQLLRIEHGAAVLVRHVLAVGDAELAVGGHHARAVDPLRPPAQVRGAVLDGPGGEPPALPLGHQRVDRACASGPSPAAP